jgi:hypothetical protein
MNSVERKRPSFTPGRGSVWERLPLSLIPAHAAAEKFRLVKHLEADHYSPDHAHVVGDSFEGLALSRSLPLGDMY